MPPIESGPHGGSDILQHTPPDHSVILEHLSDLQASIRSTFRTAVKHAETASGDVGLAVAQQKDLSTAKLERAFAEVTMHGSKLAELDAAHRTIDAHARLQYRNAEIKYLEAEPSERPAPFEFDQRIAQIRRAHDEACGKVDESLQFCEFNLKSALRRLKQTITETFHGLPEAIAATEPGERNISSHPALPTIRTWEPAREAGLLDAKILVAKANIEALRERLQPASPADAVSPATDSPAVASIPLGDGLETYRNGPVWVYNALNDTAALYRSLEEQPGDNIAQQRFALLQDALSHPQIRGNTALEKIDHLTTQLDDYQSGIYDPAWIQRHGNQPNRQVEVDYLSLDAVQERWDQLYFALHAPDERIANPPAIFRNWRNDPS